ncbi:hypothetical protein AGMMS49587_17640 [Spirochaetia bacterium]|nr:hypothetical protein AGMMS49587_17640 [Spirochaetia bacterium]
MKKLIALFIVLGLVTTAVFAEVTVGGWGRARWAPMVFNGGAGNANDKGEFSGALGAGSGPGWTGDGEAGLRFQIGGKNEANTVGFFFEARYDYSDAKYFASDNQAYAWVKPFNFLTITGGGGNLGGGHLPW